MKPHPTLAFAGALAVVLSSLCGPAAAQDAHDHSTHTQAAPTAPAVADPAGVDAVIARLRDLHDRAAANDASQRESLATDQDKALQEGMAVLAKQRRDAAARAEKMADKMKAMKAKMKDAKDSKDAPAAADPHAGHGGAAADAQAPAAGAAPADAANEGGHDHGAAAGDDAKGMKGMKGMKDMMKGMKDKEKDKAAGGGGMMDMHRSVEQRMELLEAMLQVVMDRQGASR